MTPCSRITLIFQTLVIQDFLRLFCLLLSRACVLETLIVMQVLHTILMLPTHRFYRQTLEFLRLIQDVLRRVRRLRLLIYLRPLMAVFFLIYMPVFSNLVFIIFKVFVCQCPHRFACRFGDLIYRSTRIMPFPIFWNLAGQLALIVRVHFRKLFSFTITRELLIFLTQLICTCHRRLGDMRLLVRLKLIFSHVRLRSLL